MALNKRNVDKAFEILTEVSGLKAPFFNEYDENDPDRTGCILVAGKVQDGWENVFINIKNISAKQLEIFEKRKKEVHNTSVCYVSDTDESITHLGWF